MALKDWELIRNDKGIRTYWKSKIGDTQVSVNTVMVDNTKSIFQVIRHDRFKKDLFFTFKNRKLSMERATKFMKLNKR